MDRATMLLFARFPTPGEVKTRLTAPTGNLTPEQAAAVHERALRATLAMLSGVPGLDVSLLITPDDRVQDAQSLLGDMRGGVRPQGNGDLGHRLHRAVQQALTERDQPVLLLGADSPTLPPAYILLAREALSHHDVALGPCDDGGYYLLGLRAPHAGLFEGITWGTDRVAADTRARAAAAGLNVLDLPPWYDLDRMADLRRAAGDIARLRPMPFALRRLLATIEAYT